MEVTEYVKKELAVKLQRLSNWGDDSKIDKITEYLQRTVVWAGSVSAALGTSFPSK